MAMEKYMIDDCIEKIEKLHRLSTMLKCDTIDPMIRRHIYCNMLRAASDIAYILVNEGIHNIDNFLCEA